MRAIWMVTSVVALTVFAGCSKSETKSEPKPTGETQAAATAIPEESRKVFADRCASCHGAEGKGDGVASAALNPKPRNYTDQEWQKATSDQELRDIIVKGGGGVGKSPMMPPNPDLADKPEVVNGLVALIRSFGKG